jgi:hypothetical protein
MIMFEVPICCQFVSYTQPVARFSERRPAWQKAMLYSMLVDYENHAVGEKTSMEKLNASTHV